MKIEIDENERVLNFDVSFQLLDPTGCLIAEKTLNVADLFDPKLNNHNARLFLKIIEDEENYSVVKLTSHSSPVVYPRISNKLDDE